MDDAPPNYSSRAAVDEVTLLAGPGTSISRVVRPINYVFSSKHLELDMGLKRHPVKLPCYGKGGIISGVVLVKDLKAALKVTIRLGGTCFTSVMSPGQDVGHSMKHLFSRSWTLWSYDGSSPRESEPMSLPFTFEMPDYADGMDIPLPPSHSAGNEFTTSEITYQVRVDLFRKRFHSHESLVAAILYRPKSTIPDDILACSTIFSGIQESNRWETIPMCPMSLPCSKKRRPTHCPKEIGYIVLPFPKIYASSIPIPFYLFFPSESPYLLHYQSKISVDLIKQTLIRSGKYTTTLEDLVATGETRRIDNGSCPVPPLFISPHSSSASTDETRSVCSGILRITNGCKEASWKLPGYLETRYVVRVRFHTIRLGGGKSLPGYCFDQVVELSTHDRMYSIESPHDCAC